MVTSKEVEQIALKNTDLISATRGIPKREVKKYTEALRGLSSCDVEKGTEPFWLSSGKERLEQLRQIHSVVTGLAMKFDCDISIAIGAFRILQKNCIGKANLSIGRFKDINRLITRLALNPKDREDHIH